MNKYLLKVICHLPLKRFIYDPCQLYTNLFNSENNSDMISNGEFRFLKSNLPQCNVIFDIGANVGDWTKLALSTNSNLKVHCFEPSKKIFSKLESNNFPQNVTCNNIGLSSNECTKSMYSFKEDSGMSSIYQRKGLAARGLSNPVKTEDVQLITLNNYCKKNQISHIDYLKMDIEGHELEALKGGISLFEENKVNIVQFEYGGCNIDSKTFLKDFFELFEKLNYSFYKIYPNHIERIKEYDQRLDNFQYQNWLIIKNDHKFIP
jgi:FkbM family methyltransferase